MATENRWGAERIRGELLKLGIRVSKRTIQKYIRRVRSPGGPRGQTWMTFLKNHADDIWACDFLQLYDLASRPIFAFFIVKHGSREVVHFNVLILGEDSLRRVLEEWTSHFNPSRPHQGLGQRIPSEAVGLRPANTDGRVVAWPILGGPHHDDRRVA